MESLECSRIRGRVYKRSFLFASVKWGQLQFSKQNRLAALIFVVSFKTLFATACWHCFVWLAPTMEVGHLVSCRKFGFCLPDGSQYYHVWTATHALCPYLFHTFFHLPTSTGGGTTFCLSVECPPIDGLRLQHHWSRAIFGTDGALLILSNGLCLHFCMVVQTRSFGTYYKANALAAPDWPVSCLQISSMR